jgi:prepilin-type N-terminal cleavage/methylation domain-containing protein
MRKQRGLTLLEFAIVLTVAGILMAGGAALLQRFGTRNQVHAAADRVVDHLWELRSHAVTGMRNPCMDFPAPDSVRMYSDASPAPDGFTADDKLLGGFRFRGGVRALGLVGGRGDSHAVCFESRGILGSAATALELTLGARAGGPDTRRVRLLPSTGVAKSI